MKYITLIILACSIGIGLWFFGILGFHYRVYVENEPLINAIQITKRDQSILYLENGMMVDLKEIWIEDRIDNVKMQKGDFIELVDLGDNEYLIKGLVRQINWGKGRNQLIELPIFKDTVYRYRVKVVGQFNVTRG